jgi:hypothetical protein
MKETPKNDGDKNEDEMSPGVSAGSKNLSMTVSQAEFAALQKMVTSSEVSDKDKDQNPLPTGGAASAEPVTPDEGNVQQQEDYVMKAFRSSGLSPARFTKLLNEYSNANEEGPFGTPASKTLKVSQDSGYGPRYAVPRVETQAKKTPLPMEQTKNKSENERPKDITFANNESDDSGDGSADNQDDQGDEDNASSASEFSLEDHYTPVMTVANAADIDESLEGAFASQSETGMRSLLNNASLEGSLGNRASKLEINLQLLIGKTSSPTARLELVKLIVMMVRARHVQQLGGDGSRPLSLKVARSKAGDLVQKLKHLALDRVAACLAKDGSPGADVAAAAIAVENDEQLADEFNLPEFENNEQPDVVKILVSIKFASTASETRRAVRRVEAKAARLGGLGECDLVAAMQLQVEADRLVMICARDGIKVKFRDPIEYLEDVNAEMPPAHLAREQAVLEKFLISARQGKGQLARVRMAQESQKELDSMREATEKSHKKVTSTLLVSDKKPEGGRVRKEQGGRGKIKKKVEDMSQDEKWYHIYWNVLRPPGKPWYCRNQIKLIVEKKITPEAAHDECRMTSGSGGCTYCEKNGVATADVVERVQKIIDTVAGRNDQGSATDE